MYGYVQSNIKALNVNEGAIVISPPCYSARSIELNDKSSARTYLQTRKHRYNLPGVLYTGNIKYWLRKVKELAPNIDQTLVNSLHGPLNCEIGGLDCHVITTEDRACAHWIHRYHLLCNALVHVVGNVLIHYLYIRVSCGVWCCALCRSKHGICYRTASSTA